MSISIDQRDFQALQRRAKRLSGGNVSAAIAGMIHLAQELEGREALAAWLADGREEPSREAIGAVRAEWHGRKRSKRRTRAA